MEKETEMKVYSVTKTPKGKLKLTEGLTETPLYIIRSLTTEGANEQFDMLKALDKQNNQQDNGQG